MSMSAIKSEKARTIRKAPRKAPGYVGFVVLMMVLSFCAVADQRHPIVVFVSILPQKFFVQQVGGDRVEVNVMVGPGQSPETYEPSPKQMEKLSHAAVYFQMGMPFEKNWMKRIRSLNPNLIIIDAREGIKLRNIEEDINVLFSREGSPDQTTGMRDPHIWLNPSNVAIFMEHFSNVMQKTYPLDKTLFIENYRRFAAQLDGLDKKIKAIFNAKPTKYLLVYHPSWGYFAQRYGLIQIPVEVKGSPPNAKSLATVIEFAKRYNLHTVFTQTQFSQRDAQAVAVAIGGKVIAVDPLAEDYMGNMMHVAQQFSRDMQ